MSDTVWQCAVSHGAKAACKAWRGLTAAAVLGAWCSGTVIAVCVPTDDVLVLSEAVAIGRGCMVGCRVTSGTGLWSAVGTVNNLGDLNYLTVEDYLAVQDRPPLRAMLSVAVGFPARSHLFTVIQAERKSADVVDGWRAGVFPGVIPASLVIPGFAINTCVWWGVLVVATGAWQSLRFQRRRSRHECPLCGYRIAGDSGNARCSECGWQAAA